MKLLEVSHFGILFMLSRKKLRLTTCKESSFQINLFIEI